MIGIQIKMNIIYIHMLYYFFSDDVIKQNMGVVKVRIIDNVNNNNIIQSKMNIKCNSIFFYDDVIKQNTGVVMVRIIDNVNINNIIGTLRLNTYYFFSQTM